MARSAGSSTDVRARSAETADGRVRIPVENIEGILLLSARLHGVERDTVGLLALDTGAGYLSLDVPVADRLGLMNDLLPAGSVDFADRELPRLEIESYQADLVSPVLVLDASIVHEVTDRPVLGLLGERAWAGKALWIDYGASEVLLLPSNTVAANATGSGGSRLAGAWKARADSSRQVFATVLSPGAEPVSFDLAGDGKIVVRAVVEGGSSRAADTLSLIVDSGATKSVLFEETLERDCPEWRRWSSIRGLTAPTLVGVSEARVVRIPSLTLLSASEAGVRRTLSDAAVIRSPLAEALSRVTGRSIDGLVGYSFLRRYRLGVDYTRRILWFDPRPAGWDDRPNEYNHVGLQVERRGTAAVIAGLVTGSPADRPGIALGDTLVALDGVDVARLDLTAISKRMEGAVGSELRLKLRHLGMLREHRLRRRRLL